MWALSLSCFLVSPRHPFEQLWPVETDKNSVHPALRTNHVLNSFRHLSPPSGHGWSPVTAAIWKFSLLVARRPTTPWRRTPCGRWMQTSPGCKWTNPTGSSLATLSTQSTRFCFCNIFLSLKVSWFVPGVLPGKYGGAVSRWQRDHTGLSRQARTNQTFHRFPCH